MKLELTTNTLTITLEGFEKLWACKVNSVVIDRHHIQSVSLEEPEFDWRTIRAPGTSVPTFFYAGTFHSRIGKEFWYFKVKQPKLTLLLSGGTYQRIVFSHENIEHLYQKLEQMNTPEEVD